MFQSRVIEVNGTFVGAAVTTEYGFRFRAVHPRVDDLDGRTWASLADLRSAAGHLYITGHVSPSRAANAGLHYDVAARVPALARHQ